MNMKTLREYIAEAASGKTALGHFNISNLEGFHAIVEAAKSTGRPALVGVSEGERDFVGVREAVALVATARAQGVPVFLNADHTYSVERVKEAIDAGFDEVIFDGAKLPLEENIAKTKECVAYARASGREVVIEGEIGYIGSSSKILDAIPEGVKMERENLTHPEDAQRYVEETGVDLLAPAIGNIHGMFRGGTDPALDIELCAMIRESAGVPLVLHGGSGNSDEDFVKTIASGVVIIHVNTELRVAFKGGLVKALQENPDEVAPYKYLKAGKEAMQAVVERRMQLFGGMNV